MGRATDSILPLTKVLDSNEGGFAPVDVSDYEGQLLLTCLTKNDAGTSPTAAIKLQHSNIAQGASYTTEGAEDVELREGASTNVKIAATWTQSGAAQIESVVLVLKKNGTVSETDLTLTIEGDSSGDPDDSAIGTATVSTDDVPDSFVGITFTFATPVEVADATTYHLVLASDYTASGTNNIAWRNATGLSSGGNQTLNNGSAWTADADDSQEFIINQYTFTDVTGGGYTAVTGATATAEVLELYSGALDRYLRVHTAIGGTSTPAYYIGVHAIGNKNNA